MNSFSSRHKSYL